MQKKRKGKEIKKKKFPTVFETIAETKYMNFLIWNSIPGISKLINISYLSHSKISVVFLPAFGKKSKSGVHVETNLDKVFSLVKVGRMRIN